MGYNRRLVILPVDVYSQAHDELQSLSTNIEKQRYVTQQETERLVMEQSKLRQLTNQLEADQTRARHERMRLQQTNELELARLEAERGRQMLEWSELEKERQHQLALRQADQQCAQQRLVI